MVLMGQALYRKYRPQQFADIVNQEHVTTTLQNELTADAIAHAYLFSGPRGVGKTSIARLFAKEINAAAISKYKLEGSQLIDIIEIDAASHTGVDNVRENIIQNAYAAPAQLTYKVFIIDEVHMLSVSAFNALLKILEEPPKHAVFILATTEVHKIPATVISRCQRFDFHAIGLKSIIGRLQWICQQEKVVVPESVLQRIARQAGGAIRDAESMLGQILSTADGEGTITEEQADIVLPRVNMAVVMELLESLIQKQASSYLATVAEAVQAGTHLQEMNTTLLQVLRQCLHYSVDHSLDHFSQLDTHEEMHQKLVSLMENTTTADCIRLIELFSEAGRQLSRAVIPQLPLEVAGLTWCRIDGNVIQSSSAPAEPQAKSQGVSAPKQKPVEKPKPTTVVKSVEEPKPESAPKPVSESTPEKSTVEKVVTSEPTQPDAVITPPALESQPAPAVNANQVEEAAGGEVVHLLRDKWKEVSGLIREHNHALAMSLSLASVVSVQGDIVLVGTKYEFHKKRIMDLANREAIHNVLTEVTGQNLQIECTVGDDYEMDVDVLNTLPSDNIAKVEPVDNVWDLALNTFSGEEA